MSPFFSIITSTYNAAATLPRLLDSLAAQTCRDFNWIVQDGASADATMKIVDGYRPVLPEVLAESRKDSGIYDAWNRALDRAGDDLGQWVLFLGADDLLADADVLQNVKQRILEMPLDVIYCSGDIVFFAEYKSFIKKKRSNVNSMFAEMHKKMMITHPSLFHKKDVFMPGRFDATFKIAGDYEFIVRTWKNKKQAADIGFVVSHMAMGGCSSNEAYTLTVFKERHRVRKKYFPLYYYASIVAMYAFILNLKISHQKLWLQRFCAKTACGRVLWRFLAFLRRRFIGS